MIRQSTKDLQAHLAKNVGSHMRGTSFSFGQLECVVEVGGILPFISFLKEDPRCRFELLMDICGVDNLGADLRFQVVYHLLSIKQGERIRVVCNVKDDTIVPSLENMFCSASWFEREVWDMYGIKFQGNKDLRRILTDYEFEGHPLRKDFPLTGYKEVRYDQETRRVIYTSVDLPQEYRDFNFESPWEGMKDPNRLLKSPSKEKPSD